MIQFSRKVPGRFAQQPFRAVPLDRAAYPLAGHHAEARSPDFLRVPIIENDNVITDNFRATVIYSTELPAFLERHCQPRREAATPPIASGEPPAARYRDRAVLPAIPRSAQTARRLRPRLRRRFNTRRPPRVLIRLRKP